MGLPTLNFKKSTGRFDYRNPCLTLNGGNAFFGLGATSGSSESSEVHWRWLGKWRQLRTRAREWLRLGRGINQIMETASNESARMAASRTWYKPNNGDSFERERENDCVWDGV